MFPDQFLDVPIGVTVAERDATTTVMRHTRARLNASTDDLRTVLAVLFAEVQS